VPSLPVISRQRDILRRRRRGGEEERQKRGGAAAVHTPGKMLAHARVKSAMRCERSSSLARRKQKRLAFARDSSF